MYFSLDFWIWDQKLKTQILITWGRMWPKYPGQREKGQEQ